MSLIRHIHMSRLCQAIAVCGLFIAAMVNANIACAKTVRFGTPPWPGATVKTEVVSQILQAIGYDTKTVNASTAITLQVISTGKLDVDMAIWRPSQSGMVNPFIKKGQIVELAKNIANARYGIAVPDYVWEAGVHSLADLNRYPDKFGRTIYGIESGNIGNQIMKKAIKENTYNLGKWKVVPSSVTGMLAQVGKSVREKKWIAFEAWKPHWMNIAYQLKYLPDPKRIWGKRSAVFTVARADFETQEPNAARFLKQVIVPAKTQSQWIYDYSYKNIPAHKVAHLWITSHHELVAKWLKGVTTADNKGPAIERLTFAAAKSE